MLIFTDADIGRKLMVKERAHPTGSAADRYPEYYGFFRALAIFLNNFSGWIENLKDFLVQVGVDGDATKRLLFRCSVLPHAGRPSV